MEIFRIITELHKEYHTLDPFKMSEYLDITIKKEELGIIMGYYCKMYGYKFIHISSDLDFPSMRYVCAHELGHAILHPELSSMYSSFYQRYERQANLFACGLLLSEARMDYKEYSIYQLGICAGIPSEILNELADSIEL